ISKRRQVACKNLRTGLTSMAVKGVLLQSQSKLCVTEVGGEGGCIHRMVRGGSSGLSSGGATTRGTCVLTLRGGVWPYAGQPYLMLQLGSSCPSATSTLFCSLHCMSEKMLNACEKSCSMEWLYLT